MTISRDWATPLTIGAFLLMAVTGILMFFHLDTGLNKEAHEWLGWAMVIGVGTHVTANWIAFKRHLGRPAALVVIGIFAAILAGSFFIKEDEEGGGHPGKRATQVVLRAPLSSVAPLVGQPPDALVAKLQAAGFKNASAADSVATIAGPDQGQQFKALAAILP
jgi:hypothetical protein